MERSSDRRPLVKVFREVVDTLTKPLVDLGMATEKLLRVLDHPLHRELPDGPRRPACHRLPRPSVGPPSIPVPHPAAVPGPMRLLRYLQRGARDLGLAMKELGEGLEGIRLGGVSRGGMPGSGGMPEWVLEEMNRTPAGFVSKFRRVEMVPSRKTT